MENIKKVSINHFLLNPGFSNGVTNYIKAVNELVEYPYEELVKPYEMGMSDFRKYIYKVITNNNKYKASIIEAAESQSSTLLLPNDYNVHIRLHCPFHLYKRIIKEEPDEARYSDECRAIFKAKAVSSPSHAMLEQLSDDLDVDNIHVYKNPVKLRKEYLKNIYDKDIDLIFLSRFNNLKGIEYIEEVISALPNDYKILIVGKQEVKITLSKNFDNVTFIDHIEGDEKYEYLSRAKVAISLSKFENCSMAILEALSVYTPVVAWDVGGNAELAPPTVLKAIPLGDTLAFAASIIELHDLHINNIEFEVICEALNKDFLDGVTFIENKLINNEVGVFKGLDYRSTHSEEVYIPSELTNESKQLPFFPLNVCLLTSAIKTSKFFAKHLESSSFNANIFYSGRYGREISMLDPVLIDKDSSPERIIELIKIHKIDVLIVDESYDIHINDLYRIKQKTRKPLLYTFPSPFNTNVFCLDALGFGINSDLHKRRTFISPRKSVDSEYKKILIWASSCDFIHMSESVSNVISRFDQIDIVARQDIIEKFSRMNPSINFNMVTEKNIEKAIYTDIICYTDSGVDGFLKYPANIYLQNASMLSNKGVGNEIGNLLENKIIYSYDNRMLALDFINYYSISNESNGYLDAILNAYFRNERLNAK
jgi:glycosyltransferase involved in cell wall biosynthesis